MRDGLQGMGSLKHTTEIVRKWEKTNELITVFKDMEEQYEHPGAMGRVWGPG